MPNLSLDVEPGQVPAARLKKALPVVGVALGLLLTFVASAVAASVVYYGNAVFTAYQAPSSTYNGAMNYTRMSTQHPREVRAGVTYQNGNFSTWTDPDYFVQNPNSLNAPVVQGAFCKNQSPVNVYGYCAYYN
jgi:hypothetical protein